ncbi:MAG: hypothetical protein QNJ22_08495 [Desulfosarcinaceae bacterium]|nr:hypothetical protein [Desulfosarcinaceae bacterium]
MASGSQRMSQMVFRRTFEESADGFMLDAQMLRILEQINGQRTIAQIAGRMGVTPIDLKPGLAKLYQQKLIQPVTPASTPLPATFLRDMETILAGAIGPIARIVVEDCIALLGHQRTRFPSTKAPQLIQRVAAKIADPNARKRFILKMGVKLKSIT